MVKVTTDLSVTVKLLCVRPWKCAVKRVLMQWMAAYTSNGRGYSKKAVVKPTLVSSSEITVTHADKQWSW